MTLNPAQRTIQELAQRTLAATTRPTAGAEDSTRRDGALERRHEPLRRSSDAGAELAKARSGDRELTIGPDDDASEICMDLAIQRSREALPRMRSLDMRRAWLYFLRAALLYAYRMGYSPRTTEVVLFCPSEVASLELMIGRTTLWRYVRKWRALGLMHARGHKTTVGGQTLADGTLYAVRLFPTRGRSARIRFEDLKHQGWRDLAGDIERGHTAHREVKQSERREETPEITNRILQWALPPRSPQPPLPMTVPTSGAAATSAAMLELRHAGKTQRGSLVDAAARAIASELGDPRSLNWYRHLLWQLLRLLDLGRDLLGTVHQQILRARADHTERFARKAGALLLARLRRSGLLEEIENAPRNRVGIAPTN